VTSQISTSEPSARRRCETSDCSTRSAGSPRCGSRSCVGQRDCRRGNARGNGCGNERVVPCRPGVAPSLQVRPRGAAPGREKPLPTRLSRWRHGFKFRWDYAVQRPCPGDVSAVTAHWPCGVHAAVTVRIPASTASALVDASGLCCGAPRRPARPLSTPASFQHVPSCGPDACDDVCLVDLRPPLHGANGRPHGRVRTVVPSSASRSRP
jgi:hypothetical protein